MARWIVVQGNGRPMAGIIVQGRGSHKWEGRIRAGNVFTRAGGVFTRAGGGFTRAGGGFTRAGGGGFTRARGGLVAPGCDAASHGAAKGEYFNEDVLYESNKEPVPEVSPPKSVVALAKFGHQGFGLLGLYGHQRRALLDGLDNEEWLRQLHRLQSHRKGPAFFAISGLASLLVLVFVAYHGPLFSYATTFGKGRLQENCLRLQAVESRSYPWYVSEAGNDCKTVLLDMRVYLGIRTLRGWRTHVDDQSGTVKLTKVVRSANTRSVESEVSTATFLGICKDRLAQLHNVRGLSSRCRKQREKERREQEERPNRFQSGDGHDSRVEEVSQPSFAVDPVGVTESQVKADSDSGTRIEETLQESHNEEVADHDDHIEEDLSTPPDGDEADNLIDEGTPHLDRHK
eukprot:1194906-Prorocentrum_minimum.AAC.6